MGGQVGPYVEIAPDVKLGNDVRIFGWANLYGCAVGDRTKIGPFVEIQRNASIGVDCKISSHTFICEGVHVGDRVFIGHNVTFINDLYPRATTEDGSLQTSDDWEVVTTHIEDGASLGSSVTVLAGVRIGARAIIGAGSVVTKDVGPGEIWAGNPARFLRVVE
jgi:UDP-2-acetamido-3-amino-2,3-dideoxy-glucuronate N-acetyltransferase